MVGRWDPIVSSLLSRAHILIAISLDYPELRFSNVDVTEYHRIRDSREQEESPWNLITTWGSDCLSEQVKTGNWWTEKGGGAIGSVDSQEIQWGIMRVVRGRGVPWPGKGNEILGSTASVTGEDGADQIFPYNCILKSSH